MPEPTWYIVEFRGCDEAVVRRCCGAAEAAYPDDLGCPVRRVRRLEEVRVADEVWGKGGEMRVKVLGDA